MPGLLISQNCYFKLNKNKQKLYETNIVYSNNKNIYILPRIFESNLIDVYTYNVETKKNYSIKCDITEPLFLKLKKLRNNKIYSCSIKDDTLIICFLDCISTYRIYKNEAVLIKYLETNYNLEQLFIDNNTIIVCGMYPRKKPEISSNMVKLDMDLNIILQKTDYYYYHDIGYFKNPYHVLTNNKIYVFDFASSKVWIYNSNDFELYDSFNFPLPNFELMPRDSLTKLSNEVIEQNPIPFLTDFINFSNKFYYLRKVFIKDSIALLFLHKPNIPTIYCYTFIKQANNEFTYKKDFAFKDYYIKHNFETNTLFTPSFDNKQLIATYLSKKRKKWYLNLRILDY